ETQQKYLNIINEGIKSTYKLLDDLLLWSQSQQGIMDFNPENILEILHQTANAKSINLINSIPEDTNIVADVDMLSTIIRNLLSNSIKFTNKGGKIIINSKFVTKNKQKYVQIEVIDNGVGIPKEKHSKLFDIEETTSTKGTENEEGTGLGLILCKEFVEKHKGKIWFESEVGVGTTFFFTIKN
ncbi:MAG: HAMP domain-containing histidine kinase, partial [Chlorobi bacterium]|nr:HAMP domain-containing histidine kinase [Chlorobiota bacterium]